MCFLFCPSRANIDEVETDVVDIEAKLDKAREITRSNTSAFDINTPWKPDVNFISKCIGSCLKCKKMKKAGPCVMISDL